MLVNLGIGIPTLVANYLPSDVHVFFQSENGLIGTGTPPEEGMAHPTLTDAGGRPVTALPAHPLSTAPSHLDSFAAVTSISRFSADCRSIKMGIWPTG